MPGTTAVAARPRAWILVDADSGVVLDAGNDRQPLPPASLTKLLTALVAVSKLSSTDTLTVSDRAAGEPASKINMKAGQTWTFQDALYSLLLSSANDAAAAIGERVSGSLEAFAAQMREAGTQIGLQDTPVLEDPAGLDDTFAVGGGNLLSARDLAVILRAALTQPLLAQVVATPVYQFVGPDGAHHRLGNHNQLLRTYPGAIGGKTGFTSKSGEDLAAAARRNGRTMIAVVLGAPSLWKNTSDLLDEGFATPAGAHGTGEALPAVRLPGPAAPPLTARAAGTQPPVPAAPVGPTAAATRPSTRRTIVVVAGLVAVCAVAVAARRKQVQTRRHRRLARSGPTGTR